MSSSAEYLFQDERVVLSKFANLIVSMKEHGLTKLPFDQLQALALEMPGKESVGGRAYLTNYRVLFIPHAANRVQRIHSLFLPNIKKVSSTFTRLILDTSFETSSFVMWFKSGFIKALGECRTALLAGGLATLRAEIRSCPNKLGGDLHKLGSIDPAMKAIDIFRVNAEIISKLSVSDTRVLLEVFELLDETSEYA